MLERHHAGPLPQAVAVLVRRWAKDWGAGALVEATLLQVSSAEILNDLLANPEIGPYLQALPGAATLALVQPTANARLRAALKARGMALGSELRRQANSWAPPRKASRPRSRTAAIEGTSKSAAGNVPRSDTA